MPEPAATRRDQTGLTERTVMVIEAVVDAGGPVGPRGLARTLDIDRSAVGRILKLLAELSVLDRTPDGYVPGPRLFAQARVLSALDTLPDIVMPILGELVQRFDETCYLCTFHGAVAVFTLEIQSSKPLRFVIELGRPVPIHAGAAGRAILAGLSSEQARELLGDVPLEIITPNTISDPGQLLRIAAEDRERGFAVSIEERVPGGASVAAPFFDRGGRCVGSIVFTIPLARLDMDSIDEVGAAVSESAVELTEQLRSVRHPRDSGLTSR